MTQKPTMVSCVKSLSVWSASSKPSLCGRKGLSISLSILQMSCKTPRSGRKWQTSCVTCKLMDHPLCSHIQFHLDLHGILKPSSMDFAWFAWETHYCLLLYATLSRHTIKVCNWTWPFSTSTRHLTKLSKQNHDHPHQLLLSFLFWRCFIPGYVSHHL